MPFFAMIAFGFLSRQEQEEDLKLDPAQYVHFLYKRSHLSALQKCALIF